MSPTLVRRASGLAGVALAAFVGLGLVVGCSGLGLGRVTAGASPYTDGSGVKTTVQRAIGAYHAIAAGMGVTVVVHPGTPGVASVTADDNLIAQIVTEVRDGTLYVEVQGGIRSANVPRVDVANSDLDAISASTGATVDAESLSGAALAIETSTGGSLRAGGRADTLRVTSTTGGSADLRNVEAAMVEVDVNTGGSAHVYPTESVTGVCSGGASLLIRGKPAHNDVATDASSSMRDGQ